MASIRFFGALPCQDCEVLMEELHKVRTFLVKLHQRTIQRVDTKERQATIHLARKWMFELGYGVQGAQIERLLQPKSLIPTRVSRCYEPTHGIC